MPQIVGYLTLGDFVRHCSLMSAAMSDRFATVLAFTLIGSACWIVAALPHLPAYSALVSWAAGLVASG
jgi:hypothetical protein